MWRDMLTETERQTMYMEYLVEAMLRGDTMSRYQAYAIGRQWGWLSVNDIRRMENKDPIARRRRLPAAAQHGTGGQAGIHAD